MNRIFGVATYRRAGSGHVRSRLQHYTERPVASFAARGMISDRAGVMVFAVAGSGDYWMEPEIIETYGDCPPRPI